MSGNKIILIQRARFAPAILAIGAVVLGVVASPWWLLSIPFVIIGTLFTAPNLNLINGSLSYLSMIAGLVLLRFHPAGVVILLSTALSFYGSALEMRICAKPFGPTNSEMT